MKRMGLIAAGFAVVVSTVTGFGVASASAVDQVRQAERSQVTEQVSERAASGRYPVMRGKYWTRGGCLEAGQEGINRGHWTGYECANGILQWVLWTD